MVLFAGGKLVWMEGWMEVLLVSQGTHLTERVA